ncbi:hypothetical protein [Aquimarina agarivorans]|uniref:hypothetical protein n=1 Tax=Aquimarina agarivorans TaxID=980584 RepID=UPI000248EAD6|nr:hypothetical protein [Aquimarina agarivorans]
MRASTVETIFLIFTLLSYLLIFITPFIIGKKIKKNNYLTLLFLSIILTFILSIISVYWSDDLSEEIIYKLYGFDTRGMSDSERWTRELNIEDKKTIEKIYNGSFGVGWPLKLIMSYIFFMVPYNLIICALIYGWKRKKAPNNV